MQDDASLGDPGDPWELDAGRRRPSDIVSSIRRDKDSQANAANCVVCDEGISQRYVSGDNIVLPFSECDSEGLPLDFCLGLP